MSILRYNLLARVAKSTAVNDLNQLLLDYLEGNKLSEDDLKKRLAEIFNRPDTLRRDDPEYTQILRLATTAYKPAKKLEIHQQLALSETLYQKSLNLFHLKEYSDRGTQKVQVRAILDDRTTPQCRQMHGRIFDLADLSKAVPNQVPLVHDQAYWTNANFFAGIPTKDVIPSLPPYHYNCRTRVVPYLYPAEYDRFDTMEPDHPVFTTILSDRLANYDLTPDHLPAIIARAKSCTWNPKHLEKHYADHAGQFSPKYLSAKNYSSAAFALVNDNASTFCLRSEGKDIILYALQPAPGSKSMSWLCSMYNLNWLAAISYYIKRPNQVRQLRDQLVAKSMLFEPIKKEVEMNYSADRLAQLLLELEELHTVDQYTQIISLIQDDDEDYILVYSQDLSSIRREDLPILIEAGSLSVQQLATLAATDKYVLSHKVPAPLKSLQDWLITNALT